jgi:hypothetical protein
MERGGYLRGNLTSADYDEIEMSTLTHHDLKLQRWQNEKNWLFFDWTITQITSKRPIPS